jgi:hypothetical protein
MCASPSASNQLSNQLGTGPPARPCKRRQPAGEPGRTRREQLSLYRIGHLGTRRTFTSLRLGDDAAVIAKPGRKRFLARKASGHPCATQFGTEDEAAGWNSG